jgi:hypothetical protein
MKAKWTKEQEEYLRDNLGKKTFEEISRHIGKSPQAVKLYIYRKRIVSRLCVKRNLIVELLTLKLGNLEYFYITTFFLKAVKINQKRFWRLYRGEIQPTDDEYIRLCRVLGVDLADTFEIRQLSLSFNEGE